MKTNRSKAFILILIGLIIIGAGLYIYFAANIIYDDSGSSRVKDLNCLLKLFGKTGTAVLVSATGLVFTWIGLRKLN